MPEADLELLLSAARDAGALALGMFGAPGEIREKPAGQGPVSEADLVVNRRLQDRLCGARPGYGWLSEESEDDPPARRKAPRVFIVDPIDGTRAFIAGRRAWALSLAVAEAGKAVAAVVHMPALGRTYGAALGRGAHCDTRPITVAGRAGADGAEVLAGAREFDPEAWTGGTPRMERYFRPSIAYRMCLVAEGRFDAVLSFRDTHEWDIAAGTLIAGEAGARVTTASGGDLSFNAPRPVVPGLVAANPALHAALIARRAGA